jgi:hypothetical protein
MFKDRLPDFYDEEQSGLPSVVNFQVLTRKSVKDSFEISQFQNFHMNFHKLHALFCRSLSQLSQAITSFAQDGF